MRVLHVIQELRTGGAERVVRSLVEADGLESAVAAAPGELAEGLRIYPLELLERRPWRIPANAYRLRRAIGDFRPDVVHAHNPGMAAVAALATRRPRLVSVHGVPEADWPATVRVLRLSGIPAVACGPGVDEALRAHGRPPIATIPNGVAPAPPPQDPGWGRPLVVAVGRLVEAKNHALAIRAMAQVDATLAILGEGPLHDELAALGGRVVLPGLRTDAREIMGAADAIVLSSHAEGLPLVALEALASGTPLVATAVRGLRELLTDGETALLVPPDDPAALGAAIRRVLDDRELAARLAAAGRELAAGYSEDAMVASYVALYEEDRLMPRVSVVMPAFNAERTVGAAVSSVLSQTYGDVELVVVDDGSTDATGAIAAAHPGVRVVRQDNAGVAAARNRGIAEAKGELIAFCDSDDMLFPQHLEALVAVWDRHGGIATSNCFWLYEGGIHPSKRRYKGGFPAPDRQRLAILEQNFVSTMSLFPRSLPDEIGQFDPERRWAEDWDFWLRAVYAGHSVSLQPKPLALYRVTSGGLSSRWEEMDRHVEAILRSVASRGDLRPDEREYIERRLTGPSPRELGRAGDEALRAGRYGEAAQRYREAAALVPTERPLVWKARVLRASPRLTGPLVRKRQLKIERGVGFEEGSVR